MCCNVKPKRNVWFWFQKRHLRWLESTARTCKRSSAGSVVTIFTPSEKSSLTQTRPNHPRNTTGKLHENRKPLPTTNIRNIGFSFINSHAAASENFHRVKKSISHPSSATTPKEKSSYNASTSKEIKLATTTEEKTAWSQRQLPAIHQEGDAMPGSKEPTMRKREGLIIPEPKKMKEKRTCMSLLRRKHVQDREKKKKRQGMPDRRWLWEPNRRSENSKHGFCFSEKAERLF